MRTARLGLTLLEVLVVCSLLVLTWVASTLGVARIDGFGEAAAVSVRHARARAIAGGAPIAVFGGACSDSMESVPLEIRSVRVVALPPRGLLFTPDGLPRACDGGGVGNTTILLEHRGRQAAVIVSSLGRVRWELR